MMKAAAVNAFLSSGGPHNTTRGEKQLAALEWGATYGSSFLKMASTEGRGDCCGSVTTKKKGDEGAFLSLQTGAPRLQNFTMVI